MRARVFAPISLLLALGRIVCKNNVGRSFIEIEPCVPQSTNTASLLTCHMAVSYTYFFSGVDPLAPAPRRAAVCLL